MKTPIEQRLSVTDLLNKTQDNMKKDSLENTLQKEKCIDENAKNAGEPVSENKLIQNNVDNTSVNDSDSLVNVISNKESKKLNGEINTNGITDVEKDVKMDSEVERMTDVEKRKELHQHFLASVEALKTVSHSQHFPQKDTRT